MISAVAAAERCEVPVPFLETGKRSHAVSGVNRLTETVCAFASLGAYTALVAPPPERQSQFSGPSPAYAPPWNPEMQAMMSPRPTFWSGAWEPLDGAISNQTIGATTVP